MHKINAAELLLNFLLSQLLSADFFYFLFFVTIASRTAELLIRVTGVTSKFKRRTRSCLLIPSPLSLSQRDVPRVTFDGTSSPPIQEVLNSACR